MSCSLSSFTSVFWFVLAVPIVQCLLGIITALTWSLCVFIAHQPIMPNASDSFHKRPSRPLPETFLFLSRIYLAPTNFVLQCEYPLLSLSLFNSSVLLLKAFHFYEYANPFYVARFKALIFVPPRTRLKTPCYQLSQWYNCSPIIFIFSFISLSHTGAILYLFLFLPFETHIFPCLSIKKTLFILILLPHAYTIQCLHGIQLNLLLFMCFSISILPLSLAVKSL